MFLQARRRMIRRMARMSGCSYEEMRGRYEKAERRRRIEDLVPEIARRVADELRTELKNLLASAPPPPPPAPRAEDAPRIVMEPD